MMMNDALVQHVHLLYISTIGGEAVCNDNFAPIVILYKDEKKDARLTFRFQPPAEHQALFRLSVGCQNSISEYWTREGQTTLSSAEINICTTKILK
jgi:hypothetical protein